MEVVVLLLLSTALAAAAALPSCSPGCRPRPTAHTRVTGSLNIPGQRTLSKLLVDGVQRTYLVYLPPNYDGVEPFGLLVALHGFTSNYSVMESYGLNLHAEERQYVAVYPQGLNDSWNAGGCCGLSAIDKVRAVHRLPRSSWPACSLTRWVPR